MAEGQGRKQNQRLKLFYLLEYLLENSDENHAVKIGDIKIHFKNLEVPVEQKTICTDLHLLDRRCYVPNRVRSMNDSIFYHLDDLLSFCFLLDVSHVDRLSGRIKGEVERFC